MAGLFPCSPGPLTEDIKHAFSCHREHGKEKTCATQTEQLLNLGTHSLFQILYTLLPSLRIFYPSSFFVFSVFSFSESGSVFLSSPKLTPASFSDFSHYHRECLFFRHISSLCTSTICSEHVFISLRLSWTLSSPLLDKTLQIHEQ